MGIYGLSSALPPLSLWYRQPARDWNEALPIGNGRLGGMVFGTMPRERIQLNEDSLWYGAPMQRNNPDSLANLPRIRELIFAGRIREAETLAVTAFSGVPWTMRFYQTLGDLYIDHVHANCGITDYIRILDLEKATVTVRYKSGGVTYTQEIFSTAYNQVIVVHISADKPGAISVRSHLSRLNEYDGIVRPAPATVAMHGCTGGEKGIRFAAVLRCLVENGQAGTTGEQLVVEQADAVTLLCAAATSFRSTDCLQAALACLDACSGESFAVLRDNHVTDYRSFFSRMEFTLGITGEETSSLPTDQRLEQLRKGASDPGLIGLYFHFGRYLLISCSRPGSLPANLQGIWNDSLQPPWGSKYTININIQMNYWLAESCNLAECHLPLFDLVKRMREPGRVTACTMYGCRGFTAHNNTDIWADTAPQDIWIPGTYWPMGAAWLCLHFWEHYLYGQDRGFLADAYPVMREAAEFLLDFLCPDPRGRLVTCPSVSPENTYRLPDGEKGCLTAGPTMDIQIIRALFLACIEAAALLCIDTDFSTRLSATLEHLPPLQIGKYGQLLEWCEDYDETEPGHRHISHLFGLHPANQISPRGTPEPAQAARKTLERRMAHGGGHTGWSRAWIINMWARLEDAEQAYENIIALLQKSTLPNLFDNHPPFQIDGNFGGTAGIAEMLLQSHTGEIHLLPALPQAWDQGSIKGLRARGGLGIGMHWQNHLLSSADLKCSCPGTFVIRYANKARQLVMQKGETVTINSGLETIA